MKLLLTSVFSAFLFVSASAFADYSQTKNKADDKENSQQSVHSHSSDKNKDNKKAHNPSGDAHPEGPRDDAAGEHVTGEKPRDSSQAK